MATFTPAEIKPENLLIVDSMNVSFRFLHTNNLQFGEELLNTMLSLAKSYDAGTIIALADQGGSTYRKEVFPGYKANRKEMRDNQSKEDAEKMRKFFNEYERALELIEKHPRVKLFRYPGVEADDLAAAICKRIHLLGFSQAWLISSDGDWDLLVNAHVSRFSTVTRTEYTLDTWKQPVPPEQYLSYKVLVGDKSDNIDGVVGVGPKRAAALIEEYGSAWDIYDQLPIKGTQKFIQALNDSGDLIPRNYELMDLISFCDDAIGKENLDDMCRRLIFS